MADNRFIGQYPYRLTYDRNVYMYRYLYVYMYINMKTTMIMNMDRELNMEIYRFYRFIVKDLDVR